MGETGGFGLKTYIEITGTMTVIVHLQDDSELPEFEKVLKEVTGHDAAGGYAEFIATGKFKANAFKTKMLWDASETTHAAVQAAFESTSPVSMKIENPDGSETISGEAFISKMSRESKQEDAYICTVEIQPTGEWTVA